MVDGGLKVAFARVMQVTLIWRERSSGRFHKTQMNTDRLLKEIVQHIYIRERNNTKWHKTLQKLNVYP
ncbi:hypothetical protein P3S68_027349 [Capsicum galapagoense]